MFCDLVRFLPSGNFPFSEPGCAMHVLIIASLSHYLFNGSIIRKNTERCGDLKDKTTLSIEMWDFGRHLFSDHPTNLPKSSGTLILICTTSSHDKVESKMAQ